MNIDLATGENKKPAYLAVNPFGKLPAIQAEDGTPIFESGAILLYLADKYGGPSTAEERATAAQWVLFANSTFGPAMFNANQRARDMPAFFAALDKLLGQHTWLAGSEFTVSDVAMGAYIAYYEIFIGDGAIRDGRGRRRKSAPSRSHAPAGLNTKYANVTRFMNAIKERPAFAATIGSEYNH